MHADNAFRPVGHSRQRIDALIGGIACQNGVGVADFI